EAGATQERTLEAVSSMPGVRREDGQGVALPCLPGGTGVPTTIQRGRGYAAESFLTLSSPRRCSACHRSYCACWFIQLSADVSKAMDRRTAISGLMPVRPFNKLDSVLRLTPSALAASVTLTPKGSRHNVRKISPGWG